MLYNWLKNTLTSNHCLLCLGPTDSKYLLCSSCEQDLIDNSKYCVVCAHPLSETQITKKALTCGKCQTNPPHYATSVIPHLYASPLKQMISQLKFHGNLTYAPLLAHTFTQSINQRKNHIPDCIIPVPLHKTRLRERGFNQALELARIISKHLDITLDYTICQREKPTPFQSGLSAKQRQLNLKNAFSITKTHDYKHVAIFDDVVTTGTTVNELAKQLKLSGVEVVEIWAIARTESKNN